jgi:hypothetical protein
LQWLHQCINGGCISASEVLQRGAIVAMMMLMLAEMMRDGGAVCIVFDTFCVIIFF